MLNSPPRPSSSCLDFNPQSLYIPPHPAQDSVFLSLFSSDPIFGATPCSYAPSYSAWALTPWAEVLPCMDALLTLLWATHHRVLPPRQRGLLALHPLWVLMLFFSGSAVLNSLQLHGLQDTRLPCPLSPRVCSNSCPLSRWCIRPSHPVTPFSFCLQSFSASGSFPMSRLFPSGSWSTAASVSASVLPVNIQGWFPLGFDWLVWSLCCPRDSQESYSAPKFKSISYSVLSLLYGPTLTSIHNYWKNQSFEYMDLCWQKWCLCFLIWCLGLS